MGRSLEYTLQPNEVGKGSGHLQPSPSGSIEEAAQRIIALDAEARSIACGAKERTQAALEKAFECGQWLSYAKDKLNHGEWLPWLAKIGVQQRTAHRYMALSNQTGMSNLLSARNVTHAMELAGVIKQPTTKADADDHSTKTRLPESIDAIAVSFKRWQQTQLNPNIGNATDAMLLTWEAALRPMHLAYQAVAERLRK